MLPRRADVVGLFRGGATPTAPRKTGNNDRELFKRGTSVRAVSKLVSGRQRAVAFPSHHGREIEAKQFWLAALVAALLILPIGCSPPPVKVPVDRFIEQATPPLLNLDHFAERQAVREWEFGGYGPAETLLGWKPRGVGNKRRNRLGWWLDPEASSVIVDLRLPDGEEVDTREVNLIAVTIQGRGMSGITLHWTGIDEPLQASKQLAIPLNGHGRQTYFLRVHEHEAWEGLIDRLQITVWTAPESSVCLRGVKLMHETQAPHRLRETLDRPWRAELGDEQRTALAALPGLPIERRLTVPAGAELRFAWGATGNLPDSLRFKIVAEQTGGVVDTLFDQPWHGEPLWREGVVDLADYADRELTLRLEVSAADELDPLDGLPLWAHPEVLAPSGASGLSPEQVPPNIVLIVLDTLRADRLSLYGHERPTTPHLDAWAERRAAVFETTVAAAGWTLPAHVSMFTGLDAHRHGVNWPSRSIDSLTLLAERLHGHGYATAAVTGGGYLDRTFGLDQGFERYKSWQRGTDTYPSEAPQTLDRATQSLRQLKDRPFFLFVQTYAVHTPYHPWQPYFSQFSAHDPRHQLLYRGRGTTEERLAMQLRQGNGSIPLEGDWHDLPADQYDSGVARLDGLLRPLLEALDDSDLARRTVVVVTSDHGEMLGERELWQHGHLYDPVLLVPLLIATPDGLGAGQRIGDQVRSVDLVPTLLELAGLPPVSNIDGASLVPLLRGEANETPPVAWSYGSLPESGLSLRIRNRWKLFVHDDMQSTWAGEARPFSVGPQASQEQAAEMPAELEPYVDEARRRLLEQMPGLRLHFSNRGARNDLKIHVESIDSIHGRIKIPDLSCTCVEMAGPGRMNVRVPPEEAFTMIMNDVREAQLRLTLSRQDGSRQRLDIDLLDLDRQLAFAATESGWQVKAGQPPAIGVGVWWHLSGLEKFNDLGSGDSEVRQSLRALGYIQ